MADNLELAGVELHAGDCLAWLRTLPDCSVDSIVTDPPYGLRFMGKRWDYDVPAVEVWAECLRVLKPGGHLVSFGGSRTSHRIAVRIEDAGFELRDTLLWLYGEGMPKGRNISKAIDKRRDDESDVRAVCRFLRSAIEASTHTIRSLAAEFDMHPRMIEHWAARDTDSQPNAPTLAQWERLRELLAFDDSMDGAIARLNARKGEYGEAWHERPVTGTVEEWQDRTNYAFTSRDGLERGEASSEEAIAWQGWNTALSPAYEPIILARKPFRGSVERNVLAYGTGALNIDGTRIGTEGGTRAVDFNGPRDGGVYGGGQGSHRNAIQNINAGRWPANVLLDPEAAAALDRQTGERPKGGTRQDRGAQHNGYSGGLRGGLQDQRDTGGASRFFPVLPIDAEELERFLYMPKASRSERNAGCEELPAIGNRPLNISQWQGQTNGSGAPMEPSAPARNSHPTVKPIRLMRWLIRLVTPPGGIVLDPYTGSGTTGVGAVLEGMRFMGSEYDPEHPEWFDIARARIAYWAAELEAGRISLELTVSRSAPRRIVRPLVPRGDHATGTDFRMRQGARYDDRPAPRAGELVQASFIGEEG